MSEVTTIGLYAAPVSRGANGGGVRGRLYAHYRSVLLPRDEAYMRALFESRYPGGRFIDVDDDPDWMGALADATTVVLLYPDPIGLGFSPLERRVRSALSPPAALRVLTGRRRSFLLSRSARGHLAVRRFLTRFLVAEAVLGTVVLLVTPAFVLTDRLRGRR